MRRILSIALEIVGTASALFALFATVWPANSGQSHNWYLLIAVVLVASVAACIIGTAIFGIMESNEGTLRTCIDTIASLIESGHEISDRFRKTNNPEVISLDASQWTDDVTTFLAKNLGKETATEFRNAPPYTYALPDHDFIGNSYWQHVEGKLRTLSYILNSVREHKLRVLRN